MTAITRDIEVIHVARAGPDYWISVGNKIMRFEDHHYCGPIVLTNKTGDPSATQPDDRDKFWYHYDAWVSGGKKAKMIEGKAWCDYKTSLQTWRRSISARPDLKQKEQPE